MGSSSSGVAVVLGHPDLGQPEVSADERHDLDREGLTGARGHVHDGRSSTAHGPDRLVRKNLEKEEGALEDNRRKARLETLSLV